MRKRMRRMRWVIVLSVTMSIGLGAVPIRPLVPAAHAWIINGTYYSGCTFCTLKQAICEFMGGGGKCQSVV